MAKTDGATQLWSLERPPETGLFPRWPEPSPSATSGPASPVLVVVGFDGSEPARRALDGAAKLLHGREGRLEVVYVGHIPAPALLYPEAMVAVETVLDDLELKLKDEVRSRLDGTEARWHFQRRDGAVAHELLAVADELRQHHGPDTDIVVVVGGSSHKYHRAVGSVPLNLARVDRFPVVVVP